MSKKHLAILAIIVANMIWGAAPPIFKWSLQDIGPYTLAFYRFFIASLILLPFCYKNLKILRRDFLKVFLLAFFGITINILFFVVGLKYAPSINASLLGSATPIAVIFLSGWYLRERLSKKMLTGAIIGLLGVTLVVIKPLLLNGTNLSVMGNIFFIVATLGSTAQEVIGKKVLKHYSALSITFWSFSIGTVTFFPLFFQENHGQFLLSNLTEPGVVGILFGALFSSAAAYFLFYWGLKYVKASDAGMYTYLDPFVTILIAAPLLHEFPDIFYICGAIFVFVGIYIAEGRIQYHPFHRLFGK